MNEENHSVNQDLIAKHLAGEATVAEEKLLQEWIAISNENEILYQKFKNAFELSGKHYKPGAHQSIDIDVDQEWHHFEKSVDESKKTIPLKSIIIQGPALFRIAAALLFILAAGFVINYLITRNAEQVFQTAENTEEVLLPDGSTVVLNRNSTLSFTKAYGDENREVVLSGEGFFEVVANPQQPFIIKLDQAEVTVLGTSFNINGYAVGEELEVVVTTGVVKLAPYEAAKAIELKAGERGVFKKQQKILISSLNENTNYLAWKTRKIVFAESSLASVAEILHAVYGVDMIISVPISSSCLVTATFDNQSLESVLAILKTTLDLSYRIEGNKIEIVKAGC